MSLGLSVIICTHNPRTEYLSRTLDGLRRQTLPVGAWELLLIDNASKDPVAPRFDLGWHPNGRHIHEATLGLTPARLRGIAEASADLIVFLDDDNVAEPDYLERALEIASTCPHLGAWGGQIKPEFVEPPPSWTERYWPLLAVVTVERDVWSNLVEQGTTTPCGAGLCVRSAIARRYAEERSTNSVRLNLGRKGNNLMSCEDTDLALMACDFGLGTGRFRRLNLTHLIPPTRLTLEYLTRLAENIPYSLALLRWSRGLGLPERDQPTLVGRLVNAYHRWRIPAEICAMNDARTRGEEKARREIEAKVVPNAS
jgi:hypothetical protein